MVTTWNDDDINLNDIDDQTIAVIGYGIQGRAQALNMKDSNLDVIVGLKEGGPSWEIAVNDKQKVFNVPEAVNAADIIHILTPDMVQEEVYKNNISPNLEKGDAIGFSHGAAIQCNWISPPDWVDVIMLAPKGPGQRLRELYLDGFGIPALVAVKNDYTGKAWNRVLALGKATGCARPGLIKTDFKEEVETDWFGEQVDLCGGVDKLIRTSFEVLVESGYQPEIAYFECLHELKLIVDLIQKYGISGMYRRVSETARYGGLTRGKRVLNESSKQSMLDTLAEIQSGKFASEWVNEYKTKGKNSFETHMNDLDNHTIEKVGKEMRRMMHPNEEIE